MKFINKRKSLRLFSKTLVIATPLATVISCTSAQATAQENRLNELLTGDKMKILAQQAFFNSIVDKEYENLNGSYDSKQDKWVPADPKTGIWGSERKENARKEAWTQWALSQMKNDNSFWINKVNSLIASGTVDKADFEFGKIINGVPNWQPSFDPSLNFLPTSTTKSKTLRSGYYPSWELAKKIMDSHPELGWELEVSKLLLAEIFFTTTKYEELLTKNEIKDIMGSTDPKWTNDNKWKRIKANAKQGGSWFKEQGDQPSLLLREDRDVYDDPNNPTQAKHYEVKYFFLNKYLLDNKPQLVWEKTPKPGASSIASSNIVLNDAASFNAVNDKQRGLLAKESVFTNNIVENTTQNWDPNVKTVIQNLEGFKGFSNTIINDKGDVNTTLQGLKKRLNDNMSKSGFLNDNGELKPTGEVIIKTTGSETSATAQYVQQFLPHFVAYNIKSVQVSSQDAGKVSIIEKKTGIHTSAELDLDNSNNPTGKKLFKNDTYNDEHDPTKINDEYVIVKKSKTSTEQEDLDFYKNKQLKDKWVQLVWDSKTQELTQAYWGDNKQIIKDKEKLSFAEEGGKSFFYADSNLLKDKKQLRKLIFQFAINSSSIINDAKRFMVNVRDYELRVYTSKTFEALKGLGLWKEDREFEEKVIK